jgi:putative glutamine amidotransferase
MRPKIAVPIPTSRDLEYNRTNYPSYADAVREAGGEPVPIGLDLAREAIEIVMASCDGVLLPGSPADVWPGSYGQESEPETAPPDPLREAVDRALLEHAARTGKPLLGVCFGQQMLNVFHGGTLIQHLTVMPVHHGAGKAVAVAHSVVFEANSVLRSLVPDEECVGEGNQVRLNVNSSHHQAIGLVGTGLRVVARSPQDGVVEAVESVESGRLLIGVQWHPERSTGLSATSRAIFRRLVDEAR